MSPIDSRPGEALEAWLAEGRMRVDSDIESALTGIKGAPQVILDAMRHALLAGGKRIRPCLVGLFCESAGGPLSEARAPAVAIELVHTYSLVHDDLPCMDNDSMRRGQPTVHKKWDEATGVLAGDALLTEAFRVLSGHSHAGALSAILATASGPSGMVGGQVLDMTVNLDEIPPHSRFAAVEEVHRGKTAALFGAACELGWVAGGGGAERARSAKSYGTAIGHLFQTTDDLMDITGSTDSLGKTPGKAAALMRPTASAALGVDGARESAGRYASSALSFLKTLGFPDSHHAYSLVGHLLSRAD